MIPLFIVDNILKVLSGIPKMVTISMDYKTDNVNINVVSETFVEYINVTDTEVVMPNNIIIGVDMFRFDYNDIPNILLNYVIDNFVHFDYAAMCEQSGISERKFVFSGLEVVSIQVDDYGFHINASNLPTSNAYTGTYSWVDIVQRYINYIKRARV